MPRKLYLTGVSDGEWIFATPYWTLMNQSARTVRSLQGAVLASAPGSSLDGVVQRSAALAGGLSAGSALARRRLF